MDASVTVTQLYTGTYIDRIGIFDWNGRGVSHDYFWKLDGVKLEILEMQKLMLCNAM